MAWAGGCSWFGVKGATVWTTTFSSWAVFLELTSKLKQSLGEQMDISLPLNLSAVAKHCCSPLHGCLFLSLPACFWKYRVTR